MKIVHLDEAVDIKTGMFTVAPDRLVAGELRLAGRKSLLVLHGDEYFHVGRDPNVWMVGTLYDLTRATLVDCVLVKETTTAIQDGARAYSAEAFPHFVLLGKRSLGRDDVAISSIEFTFEDATTLFNDVDAFGSVIDPAPFIETIANANNIDRPARVGASPLITYFTGELLIADVKTVLGNIRVEHRPRWSLGGPKGASIENEIWVRIVPELSVTFDDAIDRTLRVLRFLELLVGRPQNLPFLRIAVGESTPAELLDVHWSHHPRRSEEHSHSFGGPQPADLPLDPIRRPAEFANSLSWWLATDGDRCVARSRCHSSFALQSYYTVDRLIGAANSFDLLPASAVPGRVGLSSELQNAKEQARALFLSLPVSDERSSMLGAIGRIGTATLKQKVRHRVSILKEVIGDKFPEIEWVCDRAVEWRNHFVHGSAVKIRYGSPTDNLGFLTDTLEFVFAASELVEAGWDASRFLETPTSMTHPFGAYRVNHIEGLRILKEQCVGSTVDE